MPTNMQVELASKALKIRSKIIKNKIDERKTQLLDRMNKVVGR